MTVIVYILPRLLIGVSLLIEYIVSWLLFQFGNCFYIWLDNIKS